MKYRPSAKCLFGSRMPDHRRQRRVTRRESPPVAELGHPYVRQTITDTASPPPTARRSPTRPGSAAARRHHAGLRPARLPASAASPCRWARTSTSPRPVLAWPSRSTSGSARWPRCPPAALVERYGTALVARSGIVLAAGADAGRGGPRPVVPDARRPAGAQRRRERPRPVGQQRGAGPARAAPTARVVVRCQAGRHPGLHPAGRGGGAHLALTVGWRWAFVGRRRGRADDAAAVPPGAAPARRQRRRRRRAGRAVALVRDTAPAARRWPPARRLAAHLPGRLQRGAGPLRRPGRPHPDPGRHGLHGGRGRGSAGSPIGAAAVTSPSSPRCSSSARPGSH